MLVQVSAGGFRWHLHADDRERILGPSGLRLAEWRASGAARLVKHGPHRSVYRIALAGLDFHLKHYRLMDARSWLRQLIRPAKARMEYERTLAVAARCVPTITPLGLGEPDRLVRPGESFLLTRSLPGAVPLSQFIEQMLPNRPAAERTPTRQLLARELGRFIGRVHRAGIRHRDLHAGNVLVRSHEGKIELYLIDLHDVELGDPLDWAHCRDNLVIFNRWFSLKVDRPDRRRFWDGYLEESAISVAPANAQAMALDLEARTHSSSLRFWKQRDPRCLVNNRYYRRVRAPGVVGYAVTDLSEIARREFQADPDAPFRRMDIRWLKNSPSSSVIEFDLPDGDSARPVIYKRFRLVSSAAPWWSLFRKTKAMRSWVFGHGLRERCLPTPRPLIMLQRTRRGLTREGYLLTEKVTNAADLHATTALLAKWPDRARKIATRALIETIARLVRELHERGLSHRDLKASNILVRGTGANHALWHGLPTVPRPAWDLFLIDLVGVQRPAHLTNSRRVRNLARLNASFHECSWLSRGDRLRFLRIYLQAGLKGVVGWKPWWRGIAAATEAKAAQNRKSGRPLT